GGLRPIRVGVLAVGTLDGWSREEKSLVMFLLFFFFSPSFPRRGCGGWVREINGIKEGKRDNWREVGGEKRGVHG
ncbi:hypothetical protein Q0P39_14235, partial [Staphylococcus aureus]|nr:hypothetical protein [Staphylococcus aureus]